MDVSATVFLVDDDAAARRSIRWLLEGEGLSVKSYCSARDFLADRPWKRPACLVLDLRMPEMDGLDLQRELAACEERMPIVFVTGYGDVPQCVRAMKAGAVDFLEKPADDEVLLRVIHEALEKDRRRRGGADGAQIEGRLARLTLREREVQRLLCEGKTVKAIAAELAISFQTVAKHRARVLEKLEVANEVELVRLLGQFG